MEEEKSIKQLEMLYQHSIVKQKTLEDTIKKQDSEINSLIASLEKNLSMLKEEQYRNHCLKEEIAQAKKQYVKNILNFSVLKKPFIQQIPIISKVKDALQEKKQEIQDYLDGTSANNKWLDERYEEYKNELLKNNEQIKTKEDFAKIALTLKEANEEGLNVSVKKIVNKISKDYGYAKKGVHNVLKSLRLEKNNHIEQPTNNLENKKEKALLHWLEYNNLDRYNIAYANMDDLYNEYILFVRHIYGIENASYLLYSQDNLEFETAVKQIVI